MLYFFFFKQKTAYEMRISDWSSDVCSSDLREPCVIFAHLAHGSRARAKDLHRRAFRPFRQSDLARQSAPVGESTNLRIPVAAIEIGRASCRERVCQYV